MDLSVVACEGLMGDVLPSTHQILEADGLWWAGLEVAVTSEEDQGLGRVPFVPPFGVALGAWNSPEEQHAWVHRAPTADETVRERLREMLVRTRDQGFDVDRMTPTLSEAARAIATLNTAAVPEHIRHILDQLRGEFTTMGHSAGNPSAWKSHPVATVSVPMMDRHDRLALMIGVHPMCALSPRQVNALGRRLARLAKELNDQSSTG